MLDKNKIIGVVGLGYVGLPLAIAFSKKYPVIGYDYNEEKISQYKRGIDVTKELGDEIIKNCNISFTCNEQELSKCNFIIVAVPTPITSDNEPDIEPLISASEIIGKNMKKGCIVIYESTVYPGLTEEICMPILERVSNLKCGIDFKIAYSPERINPGDKKNNFENITKIVSGMDEDTLEIVSNLYLSVLKNGVFKASSIKVAEAAKVIENTQRYINIAFMNELSIIFHNLNIDTREVLEAASSKWNFLDFKPGLVGGHCIGVDPFYLINKSEKMGYEPNFLKSSRAVNDGMANFIANNIIKKLKEKTDDLKNSIVLVYGITFKENVSDVRNSKVVDIINILKDNNIKVIVKDYIADENDLKRIYGLELDNENNEKVDLIMFAVAHDKYKKINMSDINKMFKGEKYLFDIKGIFDKEEYEKNNYTYWRL